MLTLMFDACAHSHYMCELLWMAVRTDLIVHM